MAPGKRCPSIYHDRHDDCQQKDINRLPHVVNLSDKPNEVDINCGNAVEALQDNGNFQFKMREQLTDL